MNGLWGKAVRRSVTVVAGAVALAVPAQAPAATNTFLHLNGIQGESNVEGFANDIEVFDWTWGASRASGAAKASTQEITLKKFVDRSSPALLQKLYSGQAVADGSLSTRKAGEQPFVFLKFCFTNLRVTSVELAGPGDEGVQETVSFSFGSFVEKYTQQDETGGAGNSFRFGWDLMKYLQLSSATQDAC
jgi:type VI secretion system secreted protein Hcp